MIDTVRLESDRQAGYHSQLAQQIRTDLEGQVGVFVIRQQQHRKVYHFAIEKEFKARQTRDQQASKVREKYQSDCLCIRLYMAQSTLVQGKDLERTHLKLEQAQQTVQVNENDYARTTRTFQDTMLKWEQGWKAFCDTCQDLKEERIEFMKGNMWAYANAMLTVCVSDNKVRVCLHHHSDGFTHFSFHCQSCEKMRLTLEQLEPEKDMENFVHDYGTGNVIPEPPMFINYASTDAPPVSSSQIVTRPSSFICTTQRPGCAATLGQDDEAYDNTNHAGVGASSSGVPPCNTTADATALSRSVTQKSMMSPRSQVNGVNRHVSPIQDPQPQTPEHCSSGCLVCSDK